MVMSAAKFKAQCLKLMDEVNETHETITITKRGVPVARLVPCSDEKRTTVFGFLRGMVTEQDDIVGPTGEAWEADGT